jgi:hypothetical protein
MLRPARALAPKYLRPAVFAHDDINSSDEHHQMLQRRIVCISNMNESASAPRLDIAYARHSQNLVRMQDV